MPQIHIFKSGTHTSMNGASMDYTDTILQEMASSYNPETHKAPLVLGHPATDDPAMGWVSGVEFRDGGLYASTDDVLPDFAQAVKDKLYNKVSASFYTPKSPNNPTPGQWYLKHVGFLGGAVPAVKGLETPVFSDGDKELDPGIMCFADGLDFDPTSIISHGTDVAMSDAKLPWSLPRVFRNLRDWFIDQHGLDTADKIIPDWNVEDIDDAVKEQHRNDNPNFSDVPQAVDKALSQDKRTENHNPNFKESPMTEEEIKAMQAENAKLKAQMAEQAQSQNFADCTAKAEQLAKDGKILPAQVGQVASFMASLDNAETVSFADGDTTIHKTPLAFAEEIFANLPKALPDTGKTDVEQSGGVAFADNNVESITAQANKLVADAKASGQDLSFADAVAQLTVSQPDNT